MKLNDRFRELHSSIPGALCVLSLYAFFLSRATRFGDLWQLILLLLAALFVWAFVVAVEGEYGRFEARCFPAWRRELKSAEILAHLRASFQAQLKDKLLEQLVALENRERDVAKRNAIRPWRIFWLYGGDDFVARLRKDNRQLLEDVCILGATLEMAYRYRTESFTTPNRITRRNVFALMYWKWGTDWQGAQAYPKLLCEKLADRITDASTICWFDPEIMDEKLDPTEIIILRTAMSSKSSEVARAMFGDLD